MLADKLSDFLLKTEMLLMLGGAFVAVLGLVVLFTSHPRKANRKAVLASRVLGAVLFVGGTAFAVWMKVTSLSL